MKKGHKSNQDEEFWFVCAFGLLAGFLLENRLELIQ